MASYLDLHTIEEDQRIEMIGETAYCKKHGDYPVIMLFVNLEGADGFEKADRYINKLLIKFPELEIQTKTHGPTQGIVTVKIQRRSAFVKGK